MNYAVLFDLGAERIGYPTFERALEKLDGKAVYYKLYGYNAKRNNDYTDFVRRYSAHVAVPLGSRKKVRVDIRQVIDAIVLACTNKNVDGFFLICSPVDAMPMITALKELGKRVVLGVLSPSFLSDNADEVILLERGAGVESSAAPAEGAEEREAALDEYGLEEEENFLNFRDEDEREAEFLPLSGIPRAGSDGMDSIRDQLAKMVEHKLEQRRETEMQSNALELDELMKKYF